MRRTDAGRIAGRAALGAAGGAMLAAGIVAGATAAVAVALARRVITPPAVHEEPERILAVDLPRGEIVLARSDEALMPGRYSFWFDRDAGHARLGEIVEADTKTVRRRIEAVDFGRLERARRGRMNGWLRLGPWEFDHPYENVVVDTDLGPAPAWHIAPEHPRGDWIIQVHGRGSRRQEGLRAVPVARGNGWDTLLVSYRNDGEAPDSEDRRYGLGGTEWADVRAAVAHATEHGAKRIVLMGWSMGGGIVLQAVLRSPEVRERLVGVILDSPAIDWSDILRFQGEMLGLPGELAGVVSGVLGGRTGRRLTGAAAPISLRELDPVARAGELTVPVLLMHSVDDGFVPIAGSRALAAARPDLVTFRVWEGARHTKLWNADPGLWNGQITAWLQELD
ncbi:alpha/beta hydrolase family protein [Agromyces archimandritae]|uniref:Alpha/beta fold hydrolase n=1 Tax=Agromyces archimandritae TaxID=2781962 RepID=A0A975INT5_9MICO|nr:alpha/beta fold hydrolase [Agromyces archimandritae]QTX04579.1 alpha/beta fold hydrolase [Agromyces archimandritae]